MVEEDDEAQTEGSWRDTRARRGVRRQLGRAAARVPRRDDRHTDNFMLYTPLLPETASGTLEPRHAVVPLRMMCPHADLVLGRAVALDEEHTAVTVTTDVGEQEIAYTNLVIALGAVPRTFPIPGLADDAVGFKTLADAIYLRNHVLRELEAADAEPDPDRVATHLGYVFVGGGYAGVEALAELNDLVRDAMRYYPRLRAVRQRWVLVDAAPGSWPRSRPASASTPHASSSDVGSKSATAPASSPRAMTPSCFPTASGSRHNAGLDGRRQGEPTAGPARSAARRARAGTCRRVSPDQRPKDGLGARGLRGRPEPGDARGEGSTHGPARTTAGALPGTQPRCAGQGPGAEAVPGSMLGQAATLGHRKGIADVLGLKLSGFPGWFLTRTYHLTQLPLTSRKLRVVADWTAALFFRRDIAELGTLGHPESLPER